jgi:lauroyl/myristoyl acyltransferase
MTIDIQQIINSNSGISLFSAIARLIPVRLGYRLADFTADRISAQHDSRMVRAVRANQWVILGEKITGEVLDQAVRATFRSSASSIFTLYHYMMTPPAVKQLVVLNATAQRLCQRPEFDRRGLMIAGLHISSFDLALRALTLGGARPLILTIPDPQGSQFLEYQMRKKMGMNLIPATVGSLRQGIRYLQQGGVVMTGIDRPIPDPRCRPRFFGRPAHLPIHHIYLAIKAHVPVMVMVTILEPDGKNHVSTSELIEMESVPDPNAELLHNAEKVLKICEEFIRRAPHQWAMSLPVWPEMLESACLKTVEEQAQTS